MSIVNPLKEVLHNVRIRLQRNNIRGHEETYVARVANEHVLSIEEVAAILIERAGSASHYRYLVLHVKEFFEEMAYQLADGNAVSTGYYVIHPAVGGFFDSPRPEDAEVRDRDRHPVHFNFYPLGPLRALAGRIELLLEDRKEHSEIASFIDQETGAVNKGVSPLRMFEITGQRIKVAGDTPDCGVFFVSVSDPSTRYMVTSPLLVNSASSIIGTAPALPAGEYTVEIRSRYTRGGKHLQDPRVITGGFPLTAG